MPNSNLSFIEKRIKQIYGSRKGLMHTWYHKVCYYLGLYRSYKDINWQKVNRLVFVCKGNICRSAYAEQLARATGQDSASFGINGIDGVEANEVAIIVAQQLGHNLKPHRTTSFKSMRLEDSDLLIAMEPQQIIEVKMKTGNAYQYTLLGLWGDNKTPYIYDPYNCMEKYFENCFKSIESSVKNIISQRLMSSENNI